MRSIPCPVCRGAARVHGRCADGAVRGVRCDACDGGAFLVGCDDDLARAEAEVARLSERVEYCEEEAAFFAERNDVERNDHNMVVHFEACARGYARNLSGWRAVVAGLRS